MSNIIQFPQIKKEKQQVKANKARNIELTHDNMTIDITKEDIEFMEDMIMNAEIANEDEIFAICDDGYVITHNGGIKLHPEKRDLQNYLKGKMQQNRMNYLNDKRTKTLKLVK